MGMMGHFCASVCTDTGFPTVIKSVSQVELDPPTQYHRVLQYIPLWNERFVSAIRPGPGM